jgi:predicted HicB family RNase H-like nuclease
MSQTMKYNGYVGTVEYNAEDHLLHGRLLGLRSMITYGGADVSSVEKGFREAVDEYLRFCAEEGVAPEKPYPGTFNVRVGAELHQRAARYAEEHSVKLNQVVKDALEEHLQNA